MQLSDIPAWFAKRFGEDTSGTYRRAIPATTADPNAASMSLGFPPNTFTAIGAGGQPPDGRDVNGILNFLSAWAQWQGAGGPVLWNATIAANGGYPDAAVVCSLTVADLLWKSTVNNNTVNPDAGPSANWVAYVSKRATNAEALAGSSNVTVITPATLAAALANVSTVPPGMMGHFAGLVAPTGWLPASGQAVSRTTYAALFAAIGTGYGPGNGSTTFNLPDGRGVFPRGWDAGRGMDPGRGLGTYQADQFAAHDHSLAPYRMANAEVVASTGAELSTVGLGGVPNTQQAGGNETRPKNIAYLACIKY